MKNTIAVSVIVPAYNAEKVVEKCVESILAQTLQNIEIIAVDDGSKDSTRRVLQRLASKDPRIKVIEKDQNEGLSAARNSALKVASGEYVGFVDADDWVEKENFEIMYTQGKNADLIVAGYLHDAMDESRRKVNISRRVKMESGYWVDKKEIVKQAAKIDTAKMFAYTWNKLYKKDLIIQNELYFTNQVLVEDFIFNTVIWDKIKSLCVINHLGYHYVKASKDALTQKFLPDFIEIMQVRYNAIKQLEIKWGCYEGKIRTELSNVHIKHLIAGMVRNNSPKGDYSIRERYKKVKSILGHPNSREVRKYAKGKTKQEKVCNFIFKTDIVCLNLAFSELIYLMQTKSKTAFDKMK